MCATKSDTEELFWWHILLMDVFDYLSYCKIMRLNIFGDLVTLYLEIENN